MVTDFSYNLRKRIITLLEIHVNIDNFDLEHNTIGGRYP